MDEKWVDLFFRVYFKSQFLSSNPESQKSLLAPLADSVLDTAGQKLEKDRCFDLLDALTRSGGLSMEGSMLHLVIASTHCFDKSLMDTLVQDNVNPIEKVERSSLIVSSIIQGVPKEDLIAQ